MRLPQRALRAVALLAGLAVLTAVFTFPLVARGAAAGPVNTGDGQWSLWNTSWVARALFTDPLRLFDANIFAPHPATLAYSEANLAGGLLAAPGWWLTRSAYAAYATAVFLAFLLAAAAAFVLARRLTGSVPAALLAALAFGFAPAAIVRLAHVQLMMTFGVPLSLIALHAFVETRSAARGAALSAALVVAALCSGYYGIAAGIAVGLGMVYFGVTRGLWRSPRYAAGCILVVVLAGVLVLPFFLPYLQLERTGSAFRSLDETRRYSADWRSYLTSTAHVQRWVLGLAMPFDRTAFPERVLFPGVCSTVLAGVALARARRLAQPNDGAEPNGVPAHDIAGFYALLAAVAAWLSFGPAAGLYRVAYALVPGFSLTRAPARLGMLVILSIAMLAAMGLAALVRNRRRGSALALAACVLVGVETAAFPLDLRPALPVPSPYNLLAGLPRGAVAEFPFYYLEQDFHRNSLYMLYSTRHWQPLVNGYSDYIPDDFRQSVISISTFPAREAFRLLRLRGARYAVFHLNLMDHRAVPRLYDALWRYRDYLRPLAQEGDVLLYEIVAWP